MRAQPNSLKKLIKLAILSSTSLVTVWSCGSDDDDPAPPTTATVAFSEVNTILTDHCGGTTCHSSGSDYNAYVDNESLLTSRKASVIDRVVSQKNMPPSNASAAQLEMTEAERTTISNFLSQ